MGQAPRIGKDLAAVLVVEVTAVLVDQGIGDLRDRSDEGRLREVRELGEIERGGILEGLNAPAVGRSAAHSPGPGHRR